MFKNNTKKVFYDIKVKQKFPILLHRFLSVNKVPAHYQIYFFRVDKKTSKPV